MARSDAFDQYADQPGPTDPLEQIRRTQSQYSPDAPTFTPPPTPYDWGSKRPLAQPRRFSWAASGGGVPSAGESLGSRIGGRGRRYQVEFQEPPEPEQQPGEEEAQPPNSFAHPEQFAQATDGGRGGNMRAIWTPNPQPGLGGNGGNGGAAGSLAWLKRPPAGLSGGGAAVPMPEPEPVMAEAFF